MHCVLISTTFDQFVSKCLPPNYLGKVYSSTAYMHTAKSIVHYLMMHYTRVIVEVRCQNEKSHFTA